MGRLIEWFRGCPALSRREAEIARLLREAEQRGALHELWVAEWLKQRAYWLKLYDIPNGG
jgi:hypothetical protein